MEPGAGTAGDPHAGQPRRSSDTRATAVAATWARTPRQGRAPGRAPRCARTEERRGDPPAASRRGQAAAHGGNGPVLASVAGLADVAVRVGRIAALVMRMGRVQI